MMSATGLKMSGFMTLRREGLRFLNNTGLPNHFVMRKACNLLFLSLFGEVLYLWTPVYLPNDH